MTMRSEVKETAARWVFGAAALATVGAVALICAFLFAGAAPAFAEIGIWKFLSGVSWKPGEDAFGILPMICGSLAVTGGALALGVPVGILAAVFMTSFCPKRLYGSMRGAVNLMAGVPSVVYGFFGLMVIVPFVRDVFGGRGLCALSAALLLALMILPTIIVVAESALRAVPQSVYEGALALGATHERSVFAAVLPAAKSGVFAAIALGMGRAIGETMAVIMVAGNQPVIPSSLLKGVRTLTTNVVLEMGYSVGLHRDALIATAVTLFVFTLAVNLVFSALKRKAMK